MTRVQFIELLEKIITMTELLGNRIAFGCIRKCKFLLLFYLFLRGLCRFIQHFYRFIK